MKSLTDKINEGFFKNVGAVRPKPKTKEELKKLIDEEITKHGNECNLNFIDTSLITDMARLFYYSDFNGDISSWNVSNVKDFSGMFYNALKFNGDISKWDTSKVEYMSSMFSYSRFNGDISEWDVSKVKSMELMFAYSRFKGDISKWNVSKVKDMRMMFSHSPFNGDLSKWDVSNVKDMDYMFSYAQFNQDLSRWNVNATYISNIFYGCSINYKFRPKGI